jgi:hypothetical protein
MTENVKINNRTAVTSSSWLSGLFPKSCGLDHGSNPLYDVDGSIITHYTDLCLQKTEKLIYDLKLIILMSIVHRASMVKCGRAQFL